MFLLLAACRSEENTLLADMSGPERASYDAIRSYQRCLGSLVRSAKQRGDLTDRQVERLGYGCPAELDNVARTLAARDDYRAHEADFRSLPTEQKIATIKADFAALAYCKLRPCQQTD